MNFIDILIIILLIFFGVSGLKRGFFKELVMFLGTILVFYLAYKFKDPLGNWLLLRLPVFDFPNIFKGVSVLNILLYQLLAFVLVLALLLVVYSIVLTITHVFEKILKFTIVLGIPSKILGFILGILEGYVIVFVILFFLSQPAFNFQTFKDSKFTNKILTSSPVLTNITSNVVETVENIYDLTDEKDTNVLNNKLLDMMLDKKVVDYETANELYKSKKITFQGMEQVLNKYRK